MFDIVKRINELCEDHKINSVYELAKVTKIRQSTLQNIMSGNIASPKANTIEKICNGLGITLADFFADDPSAEAIIKIDTALEDDPELLEFWLETKKRPDLQIFLKQVKSAPPKAIRQMIAIIKAIEEEEERED